MNVSRPSKTWRPSIDASAGFAVFCVMVLIGTEIAVSAAMLDALIEMVVPGDALLVYGMRALFAVGAVAALRHVRRLMFPADPAPVDA